MYIGEIISDFYAEVKSSDRVGYALEKLNELHFHQLPVVDGRDYKGLIHEDQLLQIANEDKLIASIKPNPLIYIFEDQHIFDALQIISVYKTDFLPVLTKEMQYVGIITHQDILTNLNNTMDNSNQGAIIVLELNSRDHTFAHIAHLVENENAKIVHASTRHVPDHDKIEMTLKLNKNNISSIVSSFWRFDYVVKATFNDSSEQDELLDRYDHLMNYLDL